MKSKRHEVARRFIDLEARADDSDEEDEELDEGHDGFIDDDDGNALDARYVPWRRLSHVEGNSNENDGMANLIASLEERYVESGAAPIAEGHRRRRPLECHPTIVSSIDEISRWPSEHDTPLWRVCCKLGLEEEIVFFLLQMVAPRHELKSAFTRGSLRGWVYLEATMNLHLRHLLKLTPGVIRVSSGIICQRIDFKDWVSMLTFHDAKELPEVGTWVQVRRGVYKGDVGYVASTSDWGIELLLVPRLPPPKATYTSNAKRKRTFPHPAPALFDPVNIKRVYDIDPAYIRENIYSFKGHRFEHGLIVKAYDFHSTSSIATIPIHLFNLFRESRHPSLVASESKFPRPLEWELAEGDEVEIFDPKIWCRHYDHDSCKRGVITALHMDSVEVDLNNNGGVISVSWLEIRKLLSLGDFVEVIGGSCQGQTGWVESVEKHVARIIRAIDKPLTPENIEISEAHVNLLKRISVPHSLATRPPPLLLPKPDDIPWLNMEVIINARHPLKTYRGIVKNVLCKQATPSGLQVVIELLAYGPDAPFQHIILDYDDIVEANNAFKLYDFQRPKSRLFVPRNVVSQFPRAPPRAPHCASIPSQSSSSTAPGYATPMPQQPFSSSPAWDPSSRTPQPGQEHGYEPPAILASHCEPVSHDQGETHHVLLDRRLLNAPLKALVSGGTYNRKEVTVFIQDVDGHIRIQHKHYKKSITLNSEWVTPKYPNPTRDNGLLIVIKGDHCGKYVRRIHHRYEGEDAIVILGVVQRVVGQVDTLTGEQLELDISHLCLCDESKEDKKLNTSLMDALREEARKTRAK